MLEKYVEVLLVPQGTSTGPPFWALLLDLAIMGGNKTQAWLRTSQEKGSMSALSFWGELWRGQRSLGEHPTSDPLPGRAWRPSR